jgi:AcrR family transcriptional regulator
VHKGSFLQHKLKVQNGIIAAVLISFPKKGFDMAGVDDIYLASGVSKSTLYVYFGTKEVIL